LAQLLGEYVDRFNRRDWGAVRELISADAGVRIADRFVGRLSDSPYLGRYDRLAVPWYMTVGNVDGELVILVLGDESAARPRSVIRVELVDGQIVCVADYTHCPWILGAARTVKVAGRG